MKPDSVKIISISVRSAENESDIVYGLGDDGRIYWWNKWKLAWELEHKCQFATTPIKDVEGNETGYTTKKCKICGWETTED